MFAQPGKKLLFMGGEFGQWGEWQHEHSLDWHLFQDPRHAGVGRWVQDLNRLYREEPALHELDCSPAGFEWIDANDSQQSVLSFLRRGKSPDDDILVLCNFTPVPRHDYRIGVPRAGGWTELLNSDASIYGGSGLGNLGQVEAAPIAWHGRPATIRVTLPPLAVVFFRAAHGFSQSAPPDDASH
jgi:1,4-alpha-glucan branching enzyme